VAMVGHSPTLAGILAGLTMPGAKTHESGAGFVGITIGRAIFMIYLGQHT
jgi:hypothetical protein